MRFLDMSALAIGSLMRQKARVLAAVMAIAVAVLGVMLVAGHALHRRQALRDLMLLMCDMGLLTIHSPSQVEQDKQKRLSRRHLEMTDAQALRRVPGVAKVAASLSFSATAKYGRELSDIQVIGGEADLLPILRYKVTRGQPLREDADPPECLLTPAAVRLIFPREDPLDRELRLSGRRVRVAGIAESPRERNAEACFVTMPMAKAIGRLTRPTEISLRLAESAELSQVRRAVEEALSRLLGESIGEDLVSADVDLFGNQWTQLGKDLVAQAMFLMLGLIIATATVAQLLYAGVQANRAEIGTLRALGASRAAITWQITTQGVFICLIGGGLGLLLAQSYYFWPDYLRLQFRWISSPQIGLMAIVLSFGSGIVASLLPAWSAITTAPGAVMREPMR